MKRSELTATVEAARAETRNALQTIYDSLNNGQQKKIIKNAKAKALFDLYGVEYGDQSDSEGETTWPS